MTSYAADTLDLSRIQIGDIIPPLDFEATRGAFVTVFLKYWEEERVADPTLPQYDVEMIAGDPAMIVGRAASTIRLLERATYDDRIRNLLLTSATGTALDLIGTTFYGVARMIVPATETIPEVRERDDRYKLRLQLAPEAGLPRAKMRGFPLGTAKTLGGYVFHALSCDLRVAAADAASLAPGTVNVSVLAEDGEDPDAVTGRVRSWIMQDAVKGATDILDIRPANLLTPDVRAKLFALNGPAESALLTAAEANLRSFAAQRGPFRAPLYGQAIDAALKIPGIEYLQRVTPGDVLAPFGTVVRLGKVSLSLERIGPIYA